MGLFDFFRKKEEGIDWETVKISDLAYPEDSISVILAKTDSGFPATGQINTAYIDYPYKKQCPINLQFSVEIPDDSDLDTMSIENFFLDELKKGGITHLVARVATDFGFIMDMYVDNADFAQETLARLYELPNKGFDFGCGMKYDPNWKEYKRITKMLN